MKRTLIVAALLCSSAAYAAVPEILIDQEYK